MAKAPEFAVIALLSVLYGCSSSIGQPCDGKLSVRMVHDMETLGVNRSIDVIITLSDTATVADQFPMLTFPNANIALGHLTRSQITLLCRHRNVVQIDRPKTYRPNE
jgi:hypothetical protein